MLFAIRRMVVLPVPALGCTKFMIAPFCPVKLSSIEPKPLSAAKACISSPGLLYNSNTSLHFSNDPRGSR